MIDAAGLDELADRATAMLAAAHAPRVSAPCAHCGRSFVPARFHPAQRFCAGRCRVGAFRVRPRAPRGAGVAR